MNKFTACLTPIYIYAIYCEGQPPASSRSSWCTRRFVRSVKFRPGLEKFMNFSKNSELFELIGILWIFRILWIFHFIQGSASNFYIITSKFSVYVSKFSIYILRKSCRLNNPITTDEQNHALCCLHLMQAPLILTDSACETA